MCTEAKIAFILAEGIKASQMNKISETKKSKDNSSVAANAVNNKYKESKQNKKDQKINTNSTINKNVPMKCTHCGHNVPFVIKFFVKTQGGSYKGKPVNYIESKKRQFNAMNAAEAEKSKQFKAYCEIQGRVVTIPPDPQRWKMSN